MITILGPTACGKTTLAAHLAAVSNGEIISADSRQVYRGMDLGTGKDLDDYVVDDVNIPYHLIDIANPGEKYNVFRFQHDFIDAFVDITSRNKFPILCGGTGLYIESVLRGYRLSEVPQNPELRKSLEGKSLEELTAILAKFKTLHNTTDVDTAQRAIRAIEIEQFYADNPSEELEQDVRITEILQGIAKDNVIIGLNIDRDLRRKLISERLKTRLENGMLDEIRYLLSLGVTSEELIYYGLEYKYLTLHVIGKLTYQEMFSQLEIAIHQFAKRQMTWFRGMERRGIHINWIDASLPLPDKIDKVLNLAKRHDY